MFGWEVYVHVLAGQISYLTEPEIHIRSLSELSTKNVLRLRDLASQCHWLELAPC